MPNYTSNNLNYLRWFYNGLNADVCIELGNTFGQIITNRNEDLSIKKGDLRDLKAKGLISGKTITILAIEYKRFSINEFGIKTFKEYFDAE